jgi:hypothetical protein
MLSAVRSTWVTILAVTVAAVVLLSLVIGLTSPDGTVKHRADRAEPTTGSTPTATPTPAATSRRPVKVSAALAPASVRGLWPGRPRKAAVKGSRVDWCPAVRTTGSAEADRVFGHAAVERAACAAVRFVFEKRYSRLALPRRAYTADDLAFVLPSLAPSIVPTYRARIQALVASPSSDRARDDLGLLLFRGGPSAAPGHASAGAGRVFYGKAFSTSGYRHRAVWINPRWSTVAIGIDRSRGEPRVVATFHASAATPVLNVAPRRSDMLVAATEASFQLRPGRSRSWLVDGWTLTRRAYAYAPLAVG